MYVSMPDVFACIPVRVPDSAWTVWPGRKYCELDWQLPSAWRDWPLGQPHAWQLFMRVPEEQYSGFVVEHWLYGVPSGQVCVGVWQVPPTQHKLPQLELDWKAPGQVWPEEQHEPPSWEQVWVGAPETYSYAPMSQAAPTGRVVPSKSVVKCVLKEVPTSIAGEDACK